MPTKQETPVSGTRLETPVRGTGKRGRKKRLVVSLLLCVSPFCLLALSPQARTGSVPYLTPERVVDWQPGIPGGIPSFPVVSSVTDYGAVGDGTTDNASSFQDAIDAVPSEGGTILVPAGNFLIESTLEMNDRTVLRGDSPHASRLLFDLDGGDDHAIQVKRYDSGDWVQIASGFAKGSTVLTVANGSSFEAGDWVELEQENDPEVMYTEPKWQEDWAEGSVGELVKLASVSGNQLYLERPLNFGYEAGLNPMVRTQNLIEEVGFERLYLKRLDDRDGNTIRVRGSAHLWLVEVESDTTYRSHVSTGTTVACEIRNSYFHHSHDYGGGGHGYGVELGRHTTNCLVENNIFESLRHSMMVQVGANGNVFGYNYSRETVSEGEWLPPDISVHGHFPAFNLFEGNVVQEAHISDYWGPSGPGNTLLRNCIENEDLSISDSSHLQNILANDLVGSPANEIDVDSSVDGELLHGNHSSEGTQWQAGLLQVIPNSLYVADLHGDAPPFYGEMPWPASLTTRPALCNNPAKQRYMDGTPISAERFSDSFESGSASRWSSIQS